MATKSPIHLEILRLLGARDDNKAVQIEELNPSVDKLEITAAYLAGMVTHQRLN